MNTSVFLSSVLLNPGKLELSQRDMRQDSCSISLYVNCCSQVLYPGEPLSLPLLICTIWCSQ